jgi:hypothetical protein
MHAAATPAVTLVILVPSLADHTSADVRCVSWEIHTVSLCAT